MCTGVLGPVRRDIGEATLIEQQLHITHVARLVRSVAQQYDAVVNQPQQCGNYHYANEYSIMIPLRIVRESSSFGRWRRVVLRSTHKLGESVCLSEVNDCCAFATLVGRGQMELAYGMGRFQAAVNRVAQCAGAYAVHDPHLIVFGQNGIVQIFLQIR